MLDTLELPGNGSSPNGHTDPSDGPHSRTTFWPWWRRERGMPQVADAQRRLLELMDTLQEHFGQQDQRAEQLNGSVGRVANTLEQVAQSQHNTSEQIHSIAQCVDGAARQASGLSEALCQLPATMQAEAEAVRAIAQQLEISHEANTQLMHSLQQFGRTVDALRASGEAQTAALKDMHDSECEQREALTGLVREQGRRFMAAMVVAGVLGLGALATLVVTLVTVAAR
jgi:chromosome segregation ATPase